MEIYWNGFKRNEQLYRISSDFKQFDCQKEILCLVKWSWLNLIWQVLFCHWFFISVGVMFLRYDSGKYLNLKKVKI